jgi:hypothetical protein
MTLYALALQNAPVNADILRMAVSAGIYSGGIVQTGDFAVTQTTTASMNLNVGPGRAWVPGSEVGNVTGGVWSRQAMYFVSNDTTAAVSISTSDPTNPRIDVVYLAIQDAAYSGSNNQPTLAVQTGTPAVTPTAPTLPVNAIALAQVAVAAGATTITTSNITTVAIGYGRPFGHMGRTSGFQSISGNAVIQMSAAQMLRGGMTFDNANDALVVPVKGLYRCTAQVYVSGGGGTSGTATGTLLINGGTNPGPICRVAKTDGQDAAGMLQGVLALNAGDKVAMSIAMYPASGSALTAWGGSSGYSGCYVEVDYYGPN